MNNPGGKISISNTPHGVGNPNQSADKTKMVAIKLKQPHPASFSFAILIGRFVFLFDQLVFAVALFHLQLKFMFGFV